MIVSECGFSLLLSPVSRANWQQHLLKQTEHFQIIWSFPLLFLYCRISIVEDKHSHDGVYSQCIVCLVASCAGQVWRASCHCSDYDEVFTFLLVT